MNSAASPDDLESAVVAALRRFDGQSPVTAQVHHHVARGGAPGLLVRLVMAVAAEEGGSPGDALGVATAVELFEQSRYVHTDIEDDRRVRADRESVWSAFGLAHGINAGDALNAIAYLALLDDAAREPALTVRMTRALHDAEFALCAERAREVTTAVAGDDSGDALTAAACELGALSAGATPERAAAYAALARSAARSGGPAADALASAADIDRTGRIRAIFA